MARKTYNDFGVALRQLAWRAYPYLRPADRDDLTKSQFLRRLDDKVRLHIGLLQPATLEDAMSLATRYQYYEKSWEPVKEVIKPRATVAKISSDKAEVTFGADIIQEILNRLAQLEALDAETSRFRVSPTSRTSCFRCGQVGHRISDCRSPQALTLPSTPCPRCKQTGHWARDCPNNTGAPTCFRCGQPGHISRNCSQTTEQRPVSSAPTPNQSLNSEQQG